MGELVLDTKTLPAPLFDMIKTRAVKVHKFSSEIRLVPLSDSPTVDRHLAVSHASAEAERKMERLQDLCGSCADLELTVDSFLAMTHDAA